MTAKENIFILENVKGVCDIPQQGVTLLIFPMKIEGGTGAPTRIVGTWGEDVEESRHAAQSGAGSLLPGVVLLTVVGLLQGLF